MEHEVRTSEGIMRPPSRRRRFLVCLVLLTFAFGIYVGILVQAWGQHSTIWFGVDPTTNQLSLMSRKGDVIRWFTKPLPGGKYSSNTVSFGPYSPCVSATDPSTCTIAKSSGTFFYNCQTPTCDPVLDPISVTGGGGGQPQFATLQFVFLPFTEFAHLFTHATATEITINGIPISPGFVPLRPVHPTSARVPTTVDEYVTCDTSTGNIVVSQNGLKPEDTPTLEPLDSILWIGGENLFTVNPIPPPPAICPPGAPPSSSVACAVPADASPGTYSYTITNGTGDLAACTNPLTHHFIVSNH